MEKDLHNDNFEDFIKKNLESFDDEPSDAMWERIAPVIPPKPGLNWRQYVLPTALLISMVLLVIFGIKIQEYKTTSESLTKALEESNVRIEAFENTNANTNANTKSNAKSQELETHTNNTFGELDKNKSITSDAKQIDNNYYTNSNEKNNVSNQNKRTSENINTKILSNEKAEVTNGNIPNLSNIKKENIEIPSFKIDNFVVNKDSIKKQNIDAKPLATLQLKPVFPFNSQNISGVNEEFTPLKNDKIKGKSITVFAAPTILKNNIRPEKGGGHFPSKPNQKEIARIGQSVGVKLNTNLNDKWTLTVGGVFTNVSYNFHSKHNLMYDKSTEIDLSTDKVANNINYSGSSTYGEYSLGLDITRLRNSGINQGENIDIELDATANVKSIAIPIYATYNVLQKNKLSIGLKGGLSYNKLISNNLSVEDFKIEKEGIEIKDIELKQPPKPTQKNTFNTITGIALDYQVLNNWSISVEPTWSAALSENHRGILGRTKSSTFGLEIGLKYGF